MLVILGGSIEGGPSRRRCDIKTTVPESTNMSTEVDEEALIFAGGSSTFRDREKIDQIFVVVKHSDDRNDSIDKQFMPRTPRMMPRTPTAKVLFQLQCSRPRPKHQWMQR